MRLVYTDIRNHLTDQLAQLAQEYARAGRRVFYIAPNSLSFEKERRVLEVLPEEASFNITITRFAQMARYFVLNDVSNKKPVTETGLAMIFFRVLSQFEDDDLKIYGSLRKDSNFIQQLVEIYQELQRSNLTISDLADLESEVKYQDLLTIFSAFYQALQEENFESQTKIAQFLDHVDSGQLDQDLKNLVVIVDGFSRFSAEEEALVTALHDRGVEIVIGTYASHKAYKSSFLVGNLYQANVEFLLDLGQKFGVRAEILGQKQNDSLARLSALLEARRDFSSELPEISAADKQVLTIWEVVNQKEEVEELARSIRSLLNKGVRYKDILVLLGDLDAYELQIGKTFSKYDIPYYLGKQEAMSHHPLVNFVESLERIKRYNFRAEDLLNLLKSGLFKDLTDTEIDKFEQYVRYADIKGQAKFKQDFTANIQTGVNEDGQAIEKYDLDALNQIRQVVMEPLLELFSSRSLLAKNLLANKFLPFLEAIDLPNNMANLAKGKSEGVLEREGEVWQSFCDLLNEIEEIFGQTKLSLDDFLALLGQGMAASTFKLVPATLDVVNVKDYKLIEPHSSSYVFAIGLTASNFPRLSQTTGLLTDEERQQLNESLANRDLQGHFDLSGLEDVKKFHSVMISLVNSATERLILSAPQIYADNQDQLSPYLQELVDLGFEPVLKQAQGFEDRPSDLGTYKALLSRIIEANQLNQNEDLDKDQATFWAVMVRRLRQKLAQADIHIPTISDNLSVEPLSQESLDLLYPADQPLKLSASSLTTFYNNQYGYFLQKVLNLQEEDSIHPDFRHHGIYLHRVFERLMTKLDDGADFDQILDQTLLQVKQEATFKQLYSYDQEAVFSREILEGIAQGMTPILRNNPLVRVLDKAQARHYLGQENWQKTSADQKALELGFNLQMPLDQERQLEIRGQIDRLDQLVDSDSLGVVDYKSGDKKFSLEEFYNGLSPQLLTYILALKESMPMDYQAEIFGAGYLHLQNPELKFSDVASFGQSLEKFTKLFKYQGLYVKEMASQLKPYFNTSAARIFSQEEIAWLLDYTKELYRQAAKTILSGHFAINPYTVDCRTVEGQQFKTITGFEADRHMRYARQITKASRDQLLEKMKEQGGEA